MMSLLNFLLFLNGSAWQEDLSVSNTDVSFKVADNTKI